MRSSKLSAGLLAGALLAATFSGTVHSGSAASRHSTVAAARQVAAPHVRLAASTAVTKFGLADHTYDQRHLTEQQLGVMPVYVDEFIGWYRDRTFPRLVTDRQEGAIPVIAWMPRTPLDDILSGSWDSYIRTWLQGAKERGGTIFVRLMPEMNIGQPYAMRHNGNTAAKFVAAWKRIVRIGNAVGADNVRWVWNPDRAFKGSVPLAPLYPGRGWVDWVAIDGYNFGTADHGGWLWFKQLFLPTITQIRSFAPLKPMMAAEVGCTASRYKASWMNGMFTAAPQLGLKALIYFDYNLKRDWRFASSTSSLNAARAGVRLDGWVTK
jgi:Glycosyl hydrolase family 26